MSETRKYIPKIWQSNDKPAMADFNSINDDIDTALDSLSGSVNKVAGDVTTLSEK